VKVICENYLHNSIGRLIFQRAMTQDVNLVFENEEFVGAPKGTFSEGLQKKAGFSTLWVSTKSREFCGHFYWD
jgi:hypothetical protein